MTYLPEALAVVAGICNRSLPLHGHTSVKVLVTC